MGMSVAASPAAILERLEDNVGYLTPNVAALR